MFCPECGCFVGNDAVFCPDCGTRINGDTQGGYNAGAYSQPVGFSVPVMQTEKKKGKKIVKIIISLVLVAAVAVGAVFAVPNLISGSGYKKDNVFYAAAKDIGKKDDNYPLMMATAAMYNTVFNAKSLTAQWESYEEDYSMKIQLGNDISSSLFYYHSAQEDLYCGYSNGTFLGGDASYGLEIDIAEILSSNTSFWGKFSENIIESNEDRIEWYEEILANPGERTQEDLDDIKETIDSLRKYNEVYAEHYKDSKEADKALASLIKNKKLQFENFSKIFEFTSTEYNRKGKEMYPDLYDVYITDSFIGMLVQIGSFEKAAEMFAELLGDAITPDVLNVSESKSGSGKNAETKYTIKGNEIEIYECLIDYIYESSEWRNVCGDDFIDDYCDYYREKYENLDDEERGWYDFKITMTVSGNYVTELIIKDEDGDTTLDLEISDINKTEVTESDIERVEKQFDKCDDVEYIGDAEDLIEMYY